MLTVSARRSERAAYDAQDQRVVAHSIRCEPVKDLRASVQALLLTRAQRLLGGNACFGEALHRAERIVEPRHADGIIDDRRLVRGRALRTSESERRGVRQARGAGLDRA